MSREFCVVFYIRYLEKLKAMILMQHVLISFQHSDWYWNCERQEIGSEIMRVNSENESLQEQWKSDFCIMEIWFLHGTIFIWKNGRDIETSNHKKDTTFRKAILIQRNAAIVLWRLSTGNAFITAARTFDVGISTYFSITKKFPDPIRVLATVKNSAVNTFFSIRSITELLNSCFLNYWIEY